MSPGGNDGATGTDGSTLPSDSTQSPPVSSPIEIQPKKRRIETDEGQKGNIASESTKINEHQPIPTVLPFSDTTFDNEMSQTLPEHEADSDEPIIRGTKETQNLQIRLFQLKMERKNLIDELRRRIPGYKNDEHVNDQDAEIPEILVGPVARTGHDEAHQTKISQQARADDGSNKIDELESNNSRLIAEKQHLREQINTLSEKNKAIMRREAEKDEEFVRLKSTLIEKEQALKRLEDSMRSQERIISAERSRVKLLQESKRQADETIKHLRERREDTRGSRGYSTSGEIHLSLPPDSKIEKLEAELEKAKAEKSQISALLIEERSITDDLQQHLDQLQTENNGQEALNNNRSLKLQNLQTENSRLIEEKDEAIKQKNSLAASVKTLQAKLSELSKEAGQHDKKNTELQLLITFKDRHIEEKTKLLTEKQEQIKQHFSDLEFRNSEIKRLSEQSKQLETARAILQQNLEEVRLELNGARASVKSKDIRLEKLEVEVQLKRQELEKANESKSQLRGEAEKEISSLKAEILIANNNIEKMTKEHEINLEKFSQSFSLQLERQSQEAKAKLNALNSKFTSLSVQSADLRSELLSKDAEKDGLISQNQELLTRLEKHSKDAKEFERRRREIDEELQDLHSKHSAAKSEIRMKTLELQQKSQMQDVLTSRVQELEKTISDQSVKLNQFSSAEIGRLQKTADENSHAASELGRVKAEWEAKYNEWLRYHEYAETAMSNLSIAKAELETQLNAFKSNEAQREKTFRENVQIEYDNQFNYVKAEFDYKQGSLEKRLGCVAADLMTARSEKEQALSQQNQLESALQESTNEIRKFEKEVARLNQKISDATNHISTLSAEKASLASEVDTLLRKSQQHQISQESQNMLISNLEKEISTKDMTLQEKIHDLSQLNDEFNKLKQYSALMSHHAWNFVNYSLNEIQKLLFVKKMYTRLLPRIDLTPTARHPRVNKTPRLCLRRSFLVALALVRFRNAAREGLKRKCSESQEFVRGHYSQ